MPMAIRYPKLLADASRRTTPDAPNMATRPAQTNSEIWGVLYFL